MDIFSNKWLQNKVKFYIQQAIKTSDCELEFVYGSSPYKNKIEINDFMRLLTYLRQNYTSTERNTLDITTEEAPFNSGKLSNLRVTINGIEEIKRYCKTDSLDTITNVVFMKKEQYKDPNFPSIDFKSLVDKEYNFRINLKTEKILERTDQSVQVILSNWKDKQKYFRYKKRYSFYTEDNLFRIDLTAIKTNNYNFRERKNQLFKKFLESNILKNKENYELEIEYIGSDERNDIQPIDQFVQKFYMEDEIKMDEFIKKGKELQEIYDKIDMSTLKVDEPYQFMPEEMDEPIPSDDMGEYSEELKPNVSSEKIVPNLGIFDIQYEYWVDSDKENLFEILLTYNKALHCVSEKQNSDGDYPNSPKNTTYYEFRLTNEFTEVEKVLNDLKEFNGRILVPKEYIVEIDKWKPGEREIQEEKEEKNEPMKDLVPVKLWKPLPGHKPGHKGRWYDALDIPFDPYDEETWTNEYQEEVKYKQGENEKRVGLIILDKIQQIFSKYIGEVLRVKEGNNFIVKESIQENVIKEYRSLTEQEGKYTRFLGPQPISMSLEKVIPKRKHSIVEGYVVTEKADGIRAELFIGKDRLGYLITQKMEIIGTNIQFNDISGGWLFDGEYITQNKNGDPIELFMIFDVYYSDDGQSQNPSHAYTYPWIGHSKDDICRSKIIQEFKKNVTFEYLNDSKLRIGYKTYLEGPKKLQMSKKNPSKFTNVGGILKQSKKILDLSNKNGYEYEIDGLIYLPMYLSVRSLEEGVPNNFIGGEWSVNYKWKPPEENTIDFRVRFVKENTSKGERDKIVSSTVKGKVIVCKQVHLYVGYNIKEDKEYDYTWDILRNKKTNNLNEILFNPERDNKSFYMCNIPVKNGKLICEKDNSEILNGQLVEMRYTPENNEDMIWTPLRVRTDKQKPQFFTTANSIWSTIVNPVTENIITGIEDITSIDTGRKEEEKKPHEYYIEENNEETQDEPLRKLHNYIKNKLIVSICSVGKKSLSIMDTSIGRGGDIKKYLYSKNKIHFFFGLDISPDIKKAGKRYYFENMDKPKHALFVQYDTSESIRDGDGYKGTDNEIYRNKELINIIYKKKESVSKEFKEISDEYSGIASKGFHIISSQFSIHYYFKDEMTLRGYIKNISDNCMKGGYFIGTCYDGKRVFELLEDGGRIEMKDEFENSVYSIQKNYEMDNFEYQKDKKEDMFGKEIIVYMNSIGWEITEYLVNFDMFVDIMKEYNFKLAKPKLRGIHSGIFDSDKYMIEDGIGSFGSIIDNLDQLSEKDILLKKNKQNEKMKGPYYEALKMNQKENHKLKVLSELNNWFIFQKY